MIGYFCVCGGGLVGGSLTGAGRGDQRSAGEGTVSGQIVKAVGSG